MRTAVDVVRDYAAMTGAKFTYRNLMADLGLTKRTAHTAIKSLVHDCDIISIGRPREGIYKYATAKQKAEAIRQRREAGRVWMRNNSGYVEQKLKEA